MTYQHRNDRSIAPVENRRRTANSNLSFLIYYLTSSLVKRYRRRGTPRGARCHARSTFHFCYRTIYNISLINRLNSVSPNNRSSRNTEPRIAICFLDPLSNNLSAHSVRHPFLSLSFAHLFFLSQPVTHMCSVSPRSSAALSYN